MKKYIFALIALMQLTSVSYARGFVDQKVIDQYEGMVINGLTAQQVADNAKNSTFTAERRAAVIQKLDSDEKKVIRDFKEARAIEESLRNIVARDNYDIDHDPYNYAGMYDRYIHVLSFYNENLSCLHYDVDSVKRHADAFIKLTRLQDEINSLHRDYQNNKQPEKIQNALWDAHEQEYNNKIVQGLTPFKDQKMKELIDALRYVNDNATNVKCTEFTWRGLFCSDTCKQHQLFIEFKNDGIIYPTCKCGHPIIAHEAKFKNGYKGRIDLSKYIGMETTVIKSNSESGKIENKPMNKKKQDKSNISNALKL